MSLFFAFLGTMSYAIFLVKVCLLVGVVFTWSTELFELVVGAPLLCLGIACCYPFYTVLWLIPSIWCSLVSVILGEFNPSLAMSIVAQFMKALQMYLLWTVTPDESKSSVFSFDEKIISSPKFLGGLVLLILGQFLNLKVNTALKVDGVYYGIRFGIDVPWCTSFPYNVPYIQDPQYVASIMTIAGTYLMFDYDKIWAIYLVACYLYMACLESKEWTSRRVEKKSQ